LAALVLLVGANSYGKTFSALGSSSADNGPAAFGAHALKETVGPLSLYIAWLIRPLHLNSPSLLL
jgi:hypothetical protein